MKAKRLLRKLYLALMIAAVSNLPLLVYGLFTGRLMEGRIRPQPAVAVVGGHSLKHLLALF